MTPSLPLRALGLLWVGLCFILFPGATSHA